ncbi:gp56 [Mycobacterium phage Brujita]|uniref:DUF4406 domain-containing protein n=2 Tax=Brujitavirus brujita TaxID=561996 RepID=B5U3C4_9CAUD|nr:gp56 [Mycobacterium phage Brujita]ACI06270.1 hypothetical protein BRUJITA_56 [Mycobacterium phage Brujita]ADL71238.1 hypothetical protein ISLAND3_56 [Mycobacterium phage Island3]
MTIYIAGPMSRLPEFNYPMFNHVAKALRDKGYDVRNPAETDSGSTDKPWEFYMRLALQQLLECDEIMLLPGWENSRGACIEERLARELKMTVHKWDSA